MAQHFAVTKGRAIKILLRHSGHKNSAWHHHRRNQSFRRIHGVTKTILHAGNRGINLAPGVRRRHFQLVVAMGCGLGASPSEKIILRSSIARDRLSRTVANEAHASSIEVQIHYSLAGRPRKLEHQSQEVLLTIFRKLP